MELVSFAKETLQNVAETAASYRLGQSVLRQLDRMLWVVEKSAKWAVPPPLDQDERPQPELIRPLPWVFFLMMLVTLRVLRESISLANLVMGKPPLRSADVVMYIQSKRRYLRTLKYQGNRISRARAVPAPPRESWYSNVRALFAVTMCFRRQEICSNNNERADDDTERLVVKRNKKGRENSSPVVSAGESTMERLIEKMMVDLDADSDDDASFTLTNATSLKSDRSDLTIDSDQDTIFHNGTQHTQEDTQSQEQKNNKKTNEEQISTSQKDTNEPQKQVAKAKHDAKTQENVTNKDNDKTLDGVSKQSDKKSNEEDISNKQNNIVQTVQANNDSMIYINDSNNQIQENVLTDNNQNISIKDQGKSEIKSRPTKHNDTNYQEEIASTKNTHENISLETSNTDIQTQMSHEVLKILEEGQKYRKELSKRSKKALSTPEFASEMNEEKEKNTETEMSKELFTCPETSIISPKEESFTFLLHEASKIPRNPSGEQKIANGRTVKHTPNKKKGSHGQEKERRNAARSLSTNNM